MRLLLLAVVLPALALAAPLSARQIGNTLTLTPAEEHAVRLSNKDYNCAPYTIDIDGINPPFSLDVLTPGFDPTRRDTQSVLFHIGNFTVSASVPWMTNQTSLAVGQEIVLRVSDSAGAMAFSELLEVKKAKKNSYCTKYHESQWESWDGSERAYVIGLSLIGFFILLAVLSKCCPNQPGARNRRRPAAPPPLPQPPPPAPTVPVFQPAAPVPAHVHDGLDTYPPQPVNPEGASPLFRRQGPALLSITIPADDLRLSSKSWDCSYYPVNLTGSNPPFGLDVLAVPFDRADRSTQRVIQHVGNFTGESVVVPWAVAQAQLKKGDKVVLRVEDAAGTTLFSGELEVKAPGEASYCHDLDYYRQIYLPYYISSTVMLIMFAVAWTVCAAVFLPTILRDRKNRRQQQAAQAATGAVPLNTYEERAGRGRLPL
ncbi:hypothetical protein JCM8097_008664 [Rhodosporidiobolus ruineniae]